MTKSTDKPQPEIKPDIKDGVPYCNTNKCMQYKLTAGKSGYGRYYVLDTNQNVTKSNVCLPAVRQMAENNKQLLTLCKEACGALVGFDHIFMGINATDLIADLKTGIAKAESESEK